MNDDTTSEALDANGTTQKPTKKAGMFEAVAKLPTVPTIGSANTATIALPPASNKAAFRKIC
eukprot:CAMPEP_0206261496 /NCGR_PEP_ID=MMETSP0047_2-20121206/27689_1 /ASSEMBLY_ACC=CAM_ASM_000192 /TAXON_ID=195065 /ORGANISM="Chroomonas mesostigmatica_cf, Strain CCMP1168" /LENGTH=61 /DNA_ID=CAMNT_0053688721 /DNA_START=246 /DNA_END=431 /DNA_ORIENTATION=-